MPATKIVVNIPGETPYDVRIGATVLAGLGESVRRLDGVGDAPHLLVLTDSNVGPLYLEEAKSSLKAAGFRVSDIVVPAGETWPGSSPLPTCGASRLCRCPLRFWPWWIPRSAARPA